MTAFAEFRKNWLLLITAALGGSLYAMTYYTIGVFMAPWQAEFGWRKSEIAVALSIHPLCLAIASPIVGIIIDRYGVRKPALFSFLCMSLGFVGMSAIGPEKWTLYVAVAFFAFAGAASTPVLFTRSVIENFDRGRGLALGITIGASTFTALLAPLGAYGLINQVGWRGAWLAFAALPLLVFPLIFVGLKEISNVRLLSNDGRQTIVSEDAPGILLVSAIRGRVFWLMSLSFFMLTFAITAALTQMVAILGGIGLARGTAVMMTSVMGLGLAVGRLFGGYVIDRIFAPRVYAAICVIAAAGLFTLASGRSEAALIACFCIGIAGGTEIDLLAYLVSRYFGPHDYGKIYGWQWGFSLAGSIVSPIVAGYFFDQRGGYGFVLILSAVLALLAGLLSLSFGSYPFFRDTRRSAPA